MAKGTLPHVEYSCKISRLGTFSFFFFALFKLMLLVVVVGVIFLMLF